jgi:hypothetical protein
MILFLRGKAEEKRRDFSLQKNEQKQPQRRRKFLKRISYEQHEHTQHGGKKERENSD